MTYWGKKPPKPSPNYVWAEVWFGCQDGHSVDAAIESVLNAAGTLVTPILSGNYVCGWRQMDEREIAAAKKRRAATAKANAARRAKQREKELATLRALATKHGMTVMENP